MKNKNLGFRKQNKTQKNVSEKRPHTNSSPSFEILCTKISVYCPRSHKHFIFFPDFGIPTPSCFVSFFYQIKMVCVWLTIRFLWCIKRTWTNMAKRSKLASLFFSLSLHMKIWKRLFGLTRRRNKQKKCQLEQDETKEKIFKYLASWCQSDSTTVPRVVVSSTNNKSTLPVCAVCSWMTRVESRPSWHFKKKMAKTRVVRMYTRKKRKKGTYIHDVW
jgi:hypothetical protein